MKESFLLKDPSFFTIAPWSNVEGLVAGFTTRDGGTSTGVFSSNNLAFHVHDEEAVVLKNRELLAGKLGFTLADWVSAEQVHGNAIQQVTMQEKGFGARNYATSLPAVDGYWTDERELLLTSAYADCIPLYFLHSESRKIGLAHAGWKGTASGIALNMIYQWQKEGISPCEVEVVIGPGICGDCYEVDGRVAQAMDQWVQPTRSSDILKQTSASTFQLDLSHINELQLRQSGVLPSNIHRTAHCTSCDDLFFSHRRDSGATGRMLSFIGWKV